MAAALPQTAAAQTPFTSDQQRIVDLTNEVVGSSAWTLYRHQQITCDVVDTDSRIQALSDLNAFDQRATILANSLSGVPHVQAMNLVRSIETGYSSLLSPTPPELCYHAPGV